MDLVREMLLWMEDHEDRLVLFNEFRVFRDDRELTIHHIALLKSGGVIDEPKEGLLRITWDGYEFLDTVRDPEIWSKTKDGARKVGGWSLSLIRDLAAGFIKLRAGELGLPL